MKGQDYERVKQLLSKQDAILAQMKSQSPDCDPEASAQNWAEAHDRG